MSQASNQIGHGALGVRSGLRRFDELVEQTYCERRGYVDLLLGRQVGTTWTNAGVALLTSYFTTFTESFDGVPLEVASVVVLSGESLTRVELIGDTATASTFYFDPGTPSTLYVHLADGSDPSATLIRVDFIRRFGSVGSAEPRFGPEKLTDPLLQAWNSTTDLTSYNEVNVAANGVTVRQIVGEGAFAVEIIPGASGLAAGTNGGFQQAAHSTIAGGLYWFAGEYQTDPALPSGLTARVRVRLSPVGNAIVEDGRSDAAVTTGIALAMTGGERRRFIFPFRSPITVSGAMVVGVLLHNSSGGAITGGYIRVYNLTFRRVYRYEMVEPRLAEGSLPTVEIASEDPFMGAESVGLSGVRLLNSEADDLPRGYLETLLGTYDVTGRYLPLRQGGSFDDGQEITFDDTWGLWSGEVSNFDVNENDAALQLRGVESILSTVLPVETLGRQFTSTMSDRDIGRPRPILIGGPKYNMRCPRVDLEPTSRLPIWMVNDPTFGNGTPVMGQVNAWAYTDEEAATLRDTSRRVQCEFTSDTTNGLVTLFSNPGPFEVFGNSVDSDAIRNVKPNDAIDIILDGVTYAVFLTPGLYTAATLTAHVEALLDALVGPDVGVTYGYTTHQVNMGYAGANMTLLLATGANKHRSAYPLLGFEGSTDIVGLSNFGTALYDESRADQFIVRIDATGYRDNTDGRFTTVTGGGDTAIIYRVPDEIHFMWVKILGQPESSVDAASFLLGHASHQQDGVWYLGGLGPSERLSFQEIVDRAEVTCHVDVRIDQNGRISWNPRATSSSQLSDQAQRAPTLTDRDFLEFRSGKTTDDVYQAVRMEYDEDPVTGETKTREANSAGVPLRHGQRGVKTFSNVDFEPANVQVQAWNQMLIAVLPRRRATFRVKGRLIKKTVGDLIRIQRTRMLPEEVVGMSNGDLFRIMSIKKNPQNHTCEVLAYTADLPRNIDAANVLGRGVSGGLRSWPVAQWFVPAMAGVISPYRPGRLGPS